MPAFSQTNFFPSHLPNGFPYPTHNPIYPYPVTTAAPPIVYQPAPLVVDPFAAAYVHPTMTYYPPI
jgi:hypothetical protein